MSTAVEFSKGLAGVIADSTAVSQVQGDVGRLIYRGISIEDIAAKSSFEEMCYFLLRGSLPTQTQFDTFKSQLIEHRNLPKHVETVIDAAPKTAHPMAVLQAAFACLAYDESTLNLKDVEGQILTATKAIAQTATIVARVSANRRGQKILAPKNELGHSANFLNMMLGKTPDAEESKMFDVALMLHMDHDFNASTFACRVLGSTEAKLFSSLSGATGALSGPLHGGANERVLEMADKIGSPENARTWILNQLASKGKVMGFGHRVYRTMDPRAVVLRSMLETLVKKQGGNKTYDTLKVVHDTMIDELGKKEKDYIWPNVDFWSGAFYRMLNMDPIDYTPIFAVARVAGWCSHVIEMWQDNRIYRPAAKYVGPENQTLTPIALRK